MSKNSSVGISSAKAKEAFPDGSRLDCEPSSVDVSARLRAYRPVNEWGDPVHHAICDEAADIIDRLRAALGPFSRAGKTIPDFWADDSVAIRWKAGRHPWDMTVGHFRAARDAAAEVAPEARSDTSPSVGGSGDTQARSAAPATEHPDISKA